MNIQLAIKTHTDTVITATGNSRESDYINHVEPEIINHTRISLARDVATVIYAGDELKDLIARATKRMMREARNVEDMVTTLDLDASTIVDCSEEVRAWSTLISAAVEAYRVKAELEVRIIQ